MEPIFKAGSPKETYIDKITLHSGENKLELNSSNGTFITTFYQYLKKHISHKGFN